MRNLLMAFLAVIMITGQVAALRPAHADLFPFGKSNSSSNPGSFADLAEKLLPAVVNISSTQKFEENETFQDMPQFPPGSPFEDFFENFMERQGDPLQLPPPTSLGSGFIIDAKNGYIVTNNHVIKDAEEVRITFHDDETLVAEVIGRDEKTDLAVLKVDTSKKLTQVEFGDSDRLRVGDWILAIGNPFGLGGTVTAGIVSARQRDINSGPYDDFIQTDASINRGNSGGPMFDLDGRVIGINTAIFSPSGGSVGIGFAIPSSLAKPVIDQIIEFGRTRRGWLGVKIQSVTDEIAESLGLGAAQGALVAGVTEGGPAEKAGLEAGDIILEFNGHPVTEMRHLPRMVAETAIGSSANITYWRDNARHKITVEVGELEKAEENGLVETAEIDDPQDSTVIENTGLSVTSLSNAIREQYGIDVASGVVITKVERGSDAALKGLMAGDVILEANQQPVKTPEDVRKIIVDAKESGRGSVLFLINQGGDVRFTAIKLKAEEAKESEENGAGEE